MLVCLPNFGDEKGVADTLKLAGLNVPVLIQGYPDDPNQLMPSRRRDSFCGKISVCNNLVQAGIKFSLTSKHVSHPASDSFKRDLQQFLAVCCVVDGLRGVRLGAVGARPGAFNTVRYSEKILERHGISVTTVDLSEIIGAANKLDASAAAVKAKLAEITGYAPAPGVPNDKLVQMARMRGLNVNRIKLMVYMLGGALAGVAGLLVTARLDSATPNAGLGYELDSIAAVVIGGTSLNGGRGTIMGTVLGCLIIGVLNNGLVLLEVSPFWQQVIKGLVILVAVAVDKMGAKKL